MSDLFIHPVYLSARAAIIAPERAIPVTTYFTQKWLPRLGPERWCLVMLLRSLCIDAQRRSDGTKRVTCSWRQLAEMLDVHEETVASWLKHRPLPNDKPWRQIIPSDEKAKYLALFIPRLRYAYETHNGKTRRIGFVVEVLMEDHIVPEDEGRLRQQMEILQMQQGELGLETYRLADQVRGHNLDLPRISDQLSKQQNSDLHYVNRQDAVLPTQANRVQLDLQPSFVNPKNSDSLPIVKQDKFGSDSYVNQLNSELLDNKSEFSGKNVNELERLIYQLKQQVNLRKNSRRDSFEPVISLTEELLEDTHSTGMLYKVLNALYPERLDLYIAAVRVSLDVAAADAKINRGAVFVRALRDFADIAGIDLGLKRPTAELAEDEESIGNPGSQAASAPAPLAPPPVDEAIWAETQLVLRRQMTQATYDTIIQATVLLGQEDNRYIIGAYTEIAKDWLENRLRDIVQRALSSVVGEAVKVEFVLLNEED